MVVIHKGQDFVFEVMRKEKWRQRNIRINLYGEGPNYKQLRALKDSWSLDNVIFNKYKDDIKEIWKKNHGIILPSRMEGIPIVLLGAMLCARVPIVTNVGGSLELIEDDVTGYIAKYPSVNELDVALERAWSSRERWQDIGSLSRKAVLDFMPVDPVEDFAKKLESLL